MEWKYRGYSYSGSSLVVTFKEICLTNLTVRWSCFWLRSWDGSPEMYKELLMTRNSYKVIEKHRLKLKVKKPRKPT